MLIALSVNKHSTIKMFKTHFELRRHFILLKAYLFPEKSLAIYCKIVIHTKLFYSVFFSWCLIYQNLNIKKLPL